MDGYNIQRRFDFWRKCELWERDQRCSGSILNLSKTDKTLEAKWATRGQIRLCTYWTSFLLKPRPAGGDSVYTGLQRQRRPGSGCRQADEVIICHLLVSMFNNQSFHHQQLALVIVRADRRVWSLEASRIMSRYLIFMYSEKQYRVQRQHLYCNECW